MYSDVARTGQHRFQQQENTACHCRHCVQYGPPPYRGGPGNPKPPPGKESDHPLLLDLTGEIHPPSRNKLEGRDFRPEKAEISGHRNPQRKPVFAGSGPYTQVDDFSQSCPWDLNPAQWRYPGFREASPRHYPPVHGEQCGGCVVWGDVAGTHPFNTRHVPQQTHWHLPPVQFKGQTRPRRVNYGPETEQCWVCAGAEHYHLDMRVPEQSHLHTPSSNGHCGQQLVYSQGGVDRDYHLDWSRLRGGSEGSCNGHRSSHKAFFSTEVPQGDLDHPRIKTLSGCDPGLVHSRAPQGKGPATPGERQKGGQESVREQIRQVVTDLEGVLGGLKQVHVEMKEVVQQIDRLTANIDLSEEGTDPSLPCDGSNRGPLLGLQIYRHKSKGELVPHRQHSDTVDHVMLRTNSPSPIHMASVVKTNRVVPAGASNDPHRDRRVGNGHPPHLCPPQDTNHVTQLDPTPPPQTLDPTIIIVNSRSQKLPPYPHNGRVERGGKGTAPPPSTSVRTPSYPAGKCRQSSSLV